MRSLLSLLNHGCASQSGAMIVACAFSHMIRSSTLPRMKNGGFTQFKC